MSAQVRPGCKLTEVGVIPEDWDVQQIIDTCGFIVPGRNKPNVFDGNIPWITTPDLTDGGSVSESRLGLRVSESEAKNIGSKIVPAGSILMSCVGELGLVAYAENDIVINQQLHAFIPSACIDGRFLSYAIKTRVDYLYTIATKTALPYLNKDNCNSIKIPFPRLQEQRAIAAALSDMDALISGLDQLIAKKRDIKQAAMQQLLTGQQRLPGFSGEWELKRLGDVASFLKGKGLPKSELSPYGADPCIHYGELFTLYPETIGEVISRTTGSREAFRSIANDVLMPTSDVTPRGLAKASCVTVDGVILGGDILVIRSDSKQIDGSFLSYVIRSHEDQVLQLVTGSTVFHLYGSDMKKFTFSIPPAPEQTAIVNILSDMDGELTKLESRRQKTNQLKQGMMQELLTGRTRLI